MTHSTAIERPFHLPVLLHESISFLQPKNDGRYVDGTLGAGGHAAGILAASQPNGQLLAMDLDEQAIKIAKNELSQFGSRAIIVEASYATLADQLRKIEWPCVNGILLDLGLSSMQLDAAERGFSFTKDAPLDMRFNIEQDLSAAKIVNTFSETEIEDILKKYGEEPHSRHIAAAIINNRPIDTTYQLANVILAANKGKRGKIHPATRTFQALRIAVNNELEVLSNGLFEALTSLCKSGRLAVISFHSLEDRIVKQFLKYESRDCVCPPEQPVCTCSHKASIKIITKKAVIPSQNEVGMNPRARSAKLRVAEKI
jgi:16S rRNA (cytosine1402-N4)-methyltransferase